VNPLCYVYAVTEAAPANPGPGVGGAAVTTVDSGGLVAVVSEVPEAQFAEEQLAAKLEDLDWLEATARAHHRVVEAAAAAGPVLPFRLATVFHGPGRVQDLLADRHAELTATLKRVRGRREWGIKAYAVAELVADPTPPASTGRPGIDYLMRKRGRRDAAARVAQLAQEQAEQLHDQLTGLADAVVRYPPQDPRLSGHGEPMVLNASYLVTHEREPTLDALVSREWSGVRVELTGPWAPYSFSELTAADGQAGQ
jgi:hypothetical protein